jgi:hypothetical protein
MSLVVAQMREDLSNVVDTLDLPMVRSDAVMARFLNVDIYAGHRRPGPVCVRHLVEVLHAADALDASPEWYDLLAHALLLPTRTQECADTAAATELTDAVLRRPGGLAVPHDRARLGLALVVWHADVVAEPDRNALTDEVLELAGRAGGVAAAGLLRLAASAGDASGASHIVSALGRVPGAYPELAGTAHLRRRDGHEFEPYNGLLLPGMREALLDAPPELVRAVVDHVLARPPTPPAPNCWPKGAAFVTSECVQALAFSDPVSDATTSKRRAAMRVVFERCVRAVAAACTGSSEPQAATRILTSILYSSGCHSIAAMTELAHAVADPVFGITVHHFLENLPSQCLPPNLVRLRAHIPEIVETAGMAPS